MMRFDILKDIEEVGEILFCSPYNEKKYNLFMEKVKLDKPVLVLDGDMCINDTFYDNYIEIKNIDFPWMKNCIDEEPIEYLLGLFNELRPIDPVTDISDAQICTILTYLLDLIEKCILSERGCYYEGSLLHRRK